VPVSDVQNDGQAILKPIQMASDLHSDLEFLVELRGFEPRTSCMPWNADPFTGGRHSSLATRLSRPFVQIASLPFTRVHRGR
jgi:hypothetical protein